jgi:hypothetical protein
MSSYGLLQKRDTPPFMPLDTFIERGKLKQKVEKQAA